LVVVALAIVPSLEFDRLFGVRASLFDIRTCVRKANWNDTVSEPP
jgi:hypothetical protein